MFRKLLVDWSRPISAARMHHTAPRARLALESLEDRVTPAVTFEVQFGGELLVIQSNNGPDQIDVSADAAGNVVVMRHRNGRVLYENSLPQLLVIQFFGNNGHDALRAGGVDGKFQVVAEGGAGDDLLEGGQGNDDLDGGLGDDILFGGFGNDVLDGGDDNDVLNGLDGDDSADGGLGDDNITGSLGNDTLVGSDGIDILNGGAGADVLDGGAGADSLDGGADPDHLLFNEPDTWLRGGVGPDLFENLNMTESYFLDVYLPSLPPTNKDFDAATGDVFLGAG